MEKKNLGRILKKSLINTLIIGGSGIIGSIILINRENYLTTKNNLKHLESPERQLEVAQNIKENYQRQDKTYKIFHFREYNFVKRKSR
ncbi:MAG: hypothetical protein PHW73_09835 [Atribacterota bacterium]|nr:hypothetical protein [Atribacterota bacterium]